MNLKRKCGAWMILFVVIILPLLFSGAAPLQCPQQHAPLGFSIREISNRVLTPNGDKKNDKVVFKFDNDADLEFSGKIFDLRGALVAYMSQGTDSLQWDGKRNGRVVPSGIYIYRIWAQDKVFTGTLIVLR